MKSSFHGKIDEIPGVYADNFENAEHQNARAYFLSHYHTDHIQGLHSRELIEVLIKNNVTIYATELTAAIINDNKNDERIMKHVKGLKMGSTLITLPRIQENNTPEFCFTVTLIPAGHCAGSTMFLFSTGSSNILFTGDFRINESDLPKYKQLHNNEKPIKIDALYIDTTFLNTKYDYFPKRSESVEKMLYEIKKWLNLNEMSAIALHTSAKYGYEFVFNEIYKHLNIKVYVGSERWRFYSTIPHLVPGVTNEETKIHLCRNRSENASHKSCIQQCYGNYLFIHLSAMKWQHCKEEICSVRNEASTRLDVCFATHCSKAELEYFVDYLKPNKVVGFPNEFNVRKRSIFVDKEIVNKKVKVDKKVDKIMLKLMFE
ncbi:unnamed protein product [Euphydryas editha]|uniref:Protein artemis n=1 Tax=Euphydryas editha TaxID=104508 RepID=A0AAU9TCR4_EUPED|nr:unnamed protein product [Euphydryas editha]